MAMNNGRDSGPHQVLSDQKSAVRRRAQSATVALTIDGYSANFTSHIGCRYEHESPPPSKSLSSQNFDDIAQSCTRWVSLKFSPPQEDQNDFHGRQGKDLKKWDKWEKDTHSNPSDNYSLQSGKCKYILAVDVLRVVIVIVVIIIIIIITILKTSWWLHT